MEIKRKFFFIIQLKELLLFPWPPSFEIIPVHIISVDGITSMMTGIETNSERTIMSVLVLNEQNAYALKID